MFCQCFQLYKIWMAEKPQKGDIRLPFKSYFPETNGITEVEMAPRCILSQFDHVRNRKGSPKVSFRPGAIQDPVDLLFIQGPAG